jgi:HPt (histidine-containing phosphotransfer) domain-containing protein
MLVTAPKEDPYAKDTAQSDVAAALPQLEGLDTDRGLAQAGGKSDFYLSLLEQFLDTFQTFRDQIILLIGDGRYAEAARVAHSLNGVSSSLGAMRLSTAASVLEKLLCRQQPSDDALNNVAHELRPLISGLTEYFRANATIGVPAVSQVEQQPSAPLPDWVHDFRRLLSDGDVGARDLWSQRGEQLKSVLSIQRYGQVRRGLENFEFDAALEALSAHSSG